MVPSWWVTDFYDKLGPAFLLCWIYWVIASICLHELAHGWMALAMGDRTPVETGHMTWNPLVHMGTFSLVMFALVGIAWGAMPVNPTRMRWRYSDALVSLAGPAMNFVLAVVLLTSAAAWLVATEPSGWNLYQPSPTFQRNLWTFCFCGGLLNTVLCVFNLAPLPPLDGSRILASLFPPVGRLFANPGAQQVIMMAFILYFVVASKPLMGLAATAGGFYYGMMLVLFSPGQPVTQPW